MKSLVLAVAVFGLFTFFVTLSMAAEEGLIGYWSFDEGTVSGKTVKDLSGKKNDGTIMGQPKLVDGKYGKAFKFSGGDDYITVPHSESLDLTKEVTLAAWISPDRFNVWQAILGKGSHERWCYTFFVEPDATVTFEVGRGDKNKPKADWGGAGDYKTELGKWYHFAGTYDGKTVKFYVNGAPDAKSDVADIIYSNNVPFNIGRRSDGGSFAGTIDDVMIFSKALTEPEIKKIMVAGASPGTAVEASGKLATTWGSIKKR